MPVRAFIANPNVLLISTESSCSWKKGRRREDMGSGVPVELRCRVMAIMLK
jgi:hypothetical protein